MIVSWMTTNRCNLKCEHCYQDAAECDSRELTTAEGKAMIEQIARARCQENARENARALLTNTLGGYIFKHTPKGYMGNNEVQIHGR